MMDWMPRIEFGIEVGNSLKINQYLLPFKKFMDLTILLGDIEHTGDWDPSIKVTMSNGDTVETEPGYYNFDIVGNIMLLEDAYDCGFENIPEDGILDEDLENGEGSSLHHIEIKDISSIQLIRN